MTTRLRPSPLDARKPRFPSVDEGGDEGTDRSYRPSRNVRPPPAGRVSEVSGVGHDELLRSLLGDVGSVGGTPRNDGTGGEGTNRKALPSRAALYESLLAKSATPAASRRSPMRAQHMEESSGNGRPGGKGSLIPLPSSTPSWIREGNRGTRGDRPDPEASGGSDRDFDALPSSRSPRAGSTPARGVPSNVPRGSAGPDRGSSVGPRPAPRERGRLAPLDSAVLPGSARRGGATGGARSAPPGPVESPRLDEVSPRTGRPMTGRASEMAEAYFSRHEPISNVEIVAGDGRTSARSSARSKDSGDSARSSARGRMSGGVLTGKVQEGSPFVQRFVKIPPIKRRADAPRPRTETPGAADRAVASPLGAPSISVTPSTLRRPFDNGPTSARPTTADILKGVRGNTMAGGQAGVDSTEMFRYAEALSQQSGMEPEAIVAAMGRLNGIVPSHVDVSSDEADLLKSIARMNLELEQRRDAIGPAIDPADVPVNDEGPPTDRGDRGRGTAGLRRGKQQLKKRGVRQFKGAPKQGMAAPDTDMDGAGELQGPSGTPRSHVRAGAGGRPDGQPGVGDYPGRGYDAAGVDTGTGRTGQRPLGSEFYEQLQQQNQYVAGPRTQPLRQNTQGAPARPSVAGLRAMAGTTQQAQGPGNDGGVVYVRESKEGLMRQLLGVRDSHE